MTDTTNIDPVGDVEPSPFRPSEEWIDAFKAHCTEAMRLALCMYAWRRAKGVGRVRAHVDDAYVDDLVPDALADTLFGRIACRGQPLAWQLGIRAIRSRSEWRAQRRNSGCSP